ncbi:MAG TPA: endonuclease [Terriglobia bacterium]|nr:endonuclease [Terriglobia bacterium]
MKKARTYASIIERIFHSKFKPGVREMDFEREEIVTFAKKLRISLPKNLGDLVYSFRYRAAFPESIKATAGKDQTWIIRPAGRAKYRFVLVLDRPMVPNQNLATTKIPDATPGVIAKYALTDEQALLAILRYNRLVDIFSGVTCYSLQNHLRTTVPEMGQVETDELYVGVDKKGSHFVFPVQAKGGKDKLNIVQIEQDLALCVHKFPSLICRPLAAQFMQDNIIAMFEFEEGEKGLGISSEKHYQLVAPDDVTQADLDTYRSRTFD